MAPAQLVELVGQDHVVRALDHALREHGCITLIFTAPAGWGRPAARRIIARRSRETVVQTRRLGSAVRPQYRLGPLRDLIELALLLTPVELRELRDNAMYGPRRTLQGYIIDEVPALAQRLHAC